MASPKKNCNKKNYSKTDYVCFVERLRGRRGKRGSRGPRGLSGLPGTNSSFLVNQTAFVDPTFGNDATAVLQAPSLPYRTISAAITAAATKATSTLGWQVQIRPGIYNENIQLRDFVNLYGVSSLGYTQPPPPSNEIQINGSVSDFLIVNGLPNITFLYFNATNVPAITFSSGSLITITDCQFSSTYTDPDSGASCFCVTSGGGTDISFRRTNINVAVTSTNPYTAVAINLTGGFGDDVILDDCIVNLTLDGTGVSTATNVAASGADNLSSPTISSYSSIYSIGYTNISGVPTNAVYQTFAVTNASVVSRGDDVEVIVVPPETIMSIVNGEEASQTDVLNMDVNFVTGNPIPSSVGTFNSNGESTATGYFDNIRFRNFSGPPPTQNPSNLTNIFRQINVLSDTQLGGQDLTGITTVTTSYTVLETDAVIFFNGSDGDTVTLPAAPSYPGRKITVKNTSSSSCSISSSSLIDGFPSQSIGYLSSTVVNSDGTTWWIIASY